MYVIVVIVVVVAMARNVTTFVFLCPPAMPVYPSRYKILAPAAVDKVASDPKKAAEAILESTGLDPDQYRLGHTKACYAPQLERDRIRFSKLIYLAPDSSNHYDRARYAQRAFLLYIAIALIQMEKLEILLKCLIIIRFVSHIINQNFLYLL